MKVLVKKRQLIHAETDAVILSFYEEDLSLSSTAKAIDKQCKGKLSAFLETGDFKGKLYQTAVIYSDGKIPAKRIIFSGLGKKKDLDLEKIRGIYAKTASYVRFLQLKSFAAALDQINGGLNLADTAEAMVEGVNLGLYQFTPFKTLDLDNISTVDEFVIYEEEKDRYEMICLAAKTADTICRAACFARDIVSMPANNMTPTDLANEALNIAKKRKTVTCKVFDENHMKKLGMNALLGVAKGSDEPAKFIIMEYRGTKRSVAPIVLVGKGLTFDSGGISLKPAEKMDEMKTDMAGAAAVLGAIQAVSDLQLPVHVIGLVPTTENLPSGKAYKPGDILKSLSGKTIEVLNTDAEGRLILADALAYADRFKPAAVIDIATLTGACIIALGEQVIGMMGTDEELKEKIRLSAENTGERVWELPLWEDYHELIKSDVADFKNSAGRPAGTITAAAFLSKFTGDYPWVHLDIAGPAWITRDRPYIPKGASGVGVRLFTELLRKWDTK
ncbi:MAG: Cytosol aminopeptidase [Syntrophus sp. SKADARSKE-3]|nr:Cytosol aminopeptidase [Syntrophus sp. SKADARSKE-3]